METLKSSKEVSVVFGLRISPLNSCIPVNRYIQAVSTMINLSVIMYLNRYQECASLLFFHNRIVYVLIGYF